MQTINLKPVSKQISELTSKVDKKIYDMDFHTKSLLFAELSILGYFPAADAASWGMKMGFTNFDKIEYNGGLAYVFENDEDIVVSFRGTDNILNIKTDLDGLLVKDGKLPGCVHNGFLELTNKIWGKFATLLDANDENKYIWVTGHSLGGAIAAIAAVRSERRVGPNVDGVWTFGQPRIGNSHYVKGITTPYHRWVNNLDFVTKIPMWYLTFTHFGNNLYFNDSGIIAKQPLLEKILVWPTIEAFNDHNIVEYRQKILDHMSKYPDDHGDDDLN